MLGFFSEEEWAVGLIKKLVFSLKFNIKNKLRFFCQKLRILNGSLQVTLAADFSKIDGVNSIYKKEFFHDFANYSNGN